ncbi:Hypothetical predicted protein [Mytilus galloprovincialis]|uniref:B box-type domain-containing protein n=1 Tax=Mytilus galloprovincialis TaxID=29158 RepID=A0A8B6D1F5_MYTGA|nr:Hypothetical predicted protein [Mytilus galloprovincialis]
MATSSNQLEQTPLCTFCKEEKKTEWICSDCDKPLCYECKRYHLWDLERKDHKIIRANIPLDMLDIKVNDKQILKKISCKVHKDHYYTNYCIECKCLVCPECVSILSCHTRHTFKTIDKLHEETLEELDFYENHIKQTLFASVTRNLKSLKNWYNYHEKIFEEEKEKILKHTDDLRKWITEYSDKLVDELTQTFARNANVISQEKYKLEQLLRELKEKIKLINKSKVKDDIEQIRKDISNESTNIKHFDIPLFIPQKTKVFSEGKVTKESIVIIIGSLKFFDRTADVEYKILNSYNLKCFITDQHKLAHRHRQSIAISSDETILISNSWYHLELKPDKRPLINNRTDISNILFLKTNELVFEDDENILIKNKHGEIHTLYTLPNNVIQVLAICLSRAGNIMIFNERDEINSSITSMISSMLMGKTMIKFSVNVISQYGVEVKTITFEEKFLSRYGSEGFKMIENANRNICILSWFESRVTAFSQDGELRWKQDVNRPVDVDCTQLGSIIVLRKSGRLVIFSCDGYFLKEIYLSFPSEHLYSFCRKNDRELVVYSGEKLHIVQFSFVI